WVRQSHPHKLRRHCPPPIGSGVNSSGQSSQRRRRRSKRGGASPAYHPLPCVLDRPLARAMTGVGVAITSPQTPASLPAPDRVGGKLQRAIQSTQAPAIEARWRLPCSPLPSVSTGSPAFAGDDG